MTRLAWVTLATNDTYALGALVLAHSLRRVNTAHELVLLITPGVTPSMREQLNSVFDLVKEVDVMDSGDAAHLALMSRPDLGVTFTKLHCWTLTEFTKCVFLDADTMVLENCDELFEREELSAAPDAGWPDCFNSGVFVFSPSSETFAALLDFALTHGSFDGGDQGLLNMFFKDWATKDASRRLPFIYNMCSTSTYTYLPAFKYYGDQVKIVHFIGPAKPWLQMSSAVSSIGSFVQRWWEVFQAKIAGKLTPEMSGLAGVLGSGDQTGFDSQWHRQNWEQGNIDYMGRDSFDNIWKKISETLSVTQEEPQAEEAMPVSSEVKVEMMAVPVDPPPPMEPEPLPKKPEEIDESKRAVLLDPPEDVVEDKPLPTHPSQMKIVEKPPMPLVEMAVMEKPLIPPVEKPVVPVVETPAVPVVETPAVPVVETPVVPVVETPVLPVVGEPEVPVVEKPSIPAVETQPIAAKEESKARPKLDTEAAATSASVQPATPTVTSPTPPATPGDSEAPVPPKRKPGKSAPPKGKGKK